MPARERTRSNGRTRGHGVVPILEARPGGAAQRFAASMEGKHPAAVFFAAVLAGYVVLASLAVLLGVLVTDELVHTGGIGRADESAVESLVRERTGFLTDLSSVGSTLGGAPVLPIMVGLIGIVIQPFPTFSEIYMDALKALAAEIGASREPVGAGSS